MTTGRINQVTTIRETLSEITLENQSSLKRERPQSRHVSFKKYCPSSSCYPWDDVSRSPDQSRIRKCPENRDSQRVPLLPSPLLYGPFLISPRRNQNATPRISTPKQPCPDIKSQRQKPLSSGSGVASGTPTRRGPPWAPNQAIPAGLPASRFRIFLLIEYPYTTLSSRAGRRLSTHAHLSEFSFSSRILQSTGTPPHLSVGRSPASLTHIRVV